MKAAQAVVARKQRKRRGVGEGDTPFQVTLPRDGLFQPGLAFPQHRQLLNSLADKFTCKNTCCSNVSPLDKSPTWEHTRLWGIFSV